MAESWLDEIKRRAPQKFEYERLKRAYSEAIFRATTPVACGNCDLNKINELADKISQAERALDAFVDQFLDKG